MLQVKWSTDARRDLVRLFEFMNAFDPVAAKSIANALGSVSKTLMENPRIGVQIAPMGSTEVRRWLIGKYEVRYEILEDTIYILRIFHGRESRL